jgi:hypothetical protein
MNKEDVMRRIKIFYFKYYGYKYIKHFINYINKEKLNLIKDKIEFKKLNPEFFRLVSKQNEHGSLSDLNLLEVFNYNSDINFSQLMEYFTEKKDEFTNCFTNLDELTKFIVLRPFKEVYKAIIKNKEEFIKIKTTVVNNFKMSTYKTNSSLRLNTESFIEGQINNFTENLK